MATINKNLSVYDKEVACQKRRIFVLVVVAEWNEEIKKDCIMVPEAAFLDNEVPTSHIIRWNVPGSFELIWSKMF
jgi:6,7-dimethyl-8-ribityllumazine synthase